MSSEIDAINFQETVKSKIMAFDSFEQTLLGFQNSIQTIRETYTKLIPEYEGLAFLTSQLFNTNPALKDVAKQMVTSIESERQNFNTLVF